MRIISKLTITLFFAFPIWGAEPDYNKFPIPCRYDVREFYIHTNELIKEKIIDDNEKKIILFFQQAMTNLPNSIELIYPLDKGFDSFHRALESVEKSSNPLILSDYNNIIKNHFFLLKITYV